MVDYFPITECYVVLYAPNLLHRYTISFPGSTKFHTYVSSVNLTSPYLLIYISLTYINSHELVYLLLYMLINVVPYTHAHTYTEYVLSYYLPVWPGTWPRHIPPQTDRESPRGIWERLRLTPSRARKDMPGWSGRPSFLSTPLFLSL